MDRHGSVLRGIAAVVAALGAASLAAAGCAAGEVTGTGGAGTGAGGEAGAGGEVTGGGGGEGGAGPIHCDGDEDCSALDGPCADGICIGGVCDTEPINEFGSCNDGQFCTENDVCVLGQCVGGTEKFCPSDSACEIGYCEEESDACVSVPGNDGGQCEDGDSCTGVGTCMSGACQPGSQIDCSVYDGQCSVGACDPQGGCYPVPANEGGSCDDGLGNICTAGQCQSGACVSVPANEGAPCNDELFCTIGEHCLSGQCAGGSPNPCAPPGGCWIASCDETFDQCTAVPGNDGAPCDDQSPCTDGTTCSSGACIGGVPVNDGMACNDNTSCTTGEYCTGGTCGGGTGPAVYFADDFSDNSVGWLLGPEWQIGPAQMSFGGAFGADPALDHTATSDNGIAGVVIGGNASTNLHPFYYLESPPFNTANAVGPVVLGFYRWLNSDYEPYMRNNVQVWNGSQWVTVWVSGLSSIEDSAWTFISHDITAYKNAAMRIRFGFDIGDPGVFTIGSWNIDDVLVASAACP